MANSCNQNNGGDKEDSFVGDLRQGPPSLDFETICSPLIKSGLERVAIGRVIHPVGVGGK